MALHAAVRGAHASGQRDVVHERLRRRLRVRGIEQATNASPLVGGAVAGVAIDRAGSS